MSIAHTIAKPIQLLLKPLGLEIHRARRRNNTENYPPDFESHEVETMRTVRPYTMTSPENVISLIRAVDFIVKHNIPGDVVECGVWRGGSMMTAAMTLLRHNDTHRDLWLFDTFEGMSQPEEHDISFEDISATDDMKRIGKWLCAGLDDVQQAVMSVGYDSKKIHFIKGKVEDTIPQSLPDQIALLRLDTDWYASTLHEFEHLYPRLTPGGVLIIDDYGHWKGARKATDEYLKKNNIPLLLSRIDYTARIAVKPKSG